MDTIRQYLIVLMTNPIGHADYIDATVTQLLELIDDASGFFKALKK